MTHEPMFWVRLLSDGLYEGPIHNKRIEESRKQGGTWTPLYVQPQPMTVDQVIDMWTDHPDGDCLTLTEFGSIVRAVEARHGILEKL